MIELFLIERVDWVNPKDFNLDNYYNDSSIGCFLEIDLNYSYILYDLHNDYPLG